MKRESVCGTYQLESFVLEKSETERSDWGKDMHGLLIYAPTGHMSVSINKAIEPSGDNESEDIFDSILFYSGTFEVKNDEITHQVTEASNPTRIGKSLIRYARIDGETLELASPQESFGRAVLRWRRIQ